jgi:hypothetical protein
MPINGYLGGVISATAPSVTTAGASGVFTLEEQLQASAQNNWPGYQISRSLRFRLSATAYLNRTPVAGNLTTWTWSGWVKRGNLANYQRVISTTSGGSQFYFRFNSDNVFAAENAGTTFMVTTQVFRDPSAWYHIVFVWDTTNATAGDRARLYVNGSRVTAFSTMTNPSSNATTSWNSATAHYICGAATSENLDCYLTEVNFIDGQALTPASFGATDATTGVWNPIRYSGTYGNNGFYLNFKDPTSTTTIAYDYSGNSNNWTANNISVTAGTTYDSMVDVPIGYGGDTGVGGELRGNYATFSAVDYFGSPGLSEANLTISGTNPGDFGTIKLTSGKWYFEFRKNADGDNQLGIASGNAYQSSGNLGTTCFRRTWRDNVGTPSWLTDSGTPGSGTAQSLATGDILGVALDLDNNAVYFAKNNTWMNSGVPTSGSSKTGAIWTDLSGGTWQIYAGGNSNGCYTTLNAGQRPFIYTAPSGFKVFCTQNLPATTISNGASYMAATTYSGTGATQTVSNAVNSISFQPDLVWIKSRSAATDHKLTDVVRGVTKALISDTSGAETTDTNGLTAFGSSSFTIGTDTVYNNSGATYIGWQWKASGSTVSNTAGSITSTVSANTTAGFSVLTYTGTGATATIGHGLGVTPSMMIMKKRSNAGSWKVYHTVLGNTKILEMNATDGAQTSSTYWNNTSPTSTLITVGSNADINASSETYVSYCWTAISGYSAFISYTGNGSGDGPFVYCGFRPRWLMIKRYDASGDPWWLVDSTRSPYNQTTLALRPSAANAEDNGGNANFDFLANGFKARTSGGGNGNESGATYIVAAFAENPFNISRAR